MEPKEMITRKANRTTEGCQGVPRGRGLAFPKNTTALMAISIEHHPLQGDLSLTGDQESSNNEDIWMVSAQPLQRAIHFLV